MHTDSLGHHLQAWLKRNRVQIEDPLFVSAVDVAFENEMRRAAQPPVSRRTKSSPTLRSSRSFGCERKETA